MTCRAQLSRQQLTVLNVNENGTQITPYFNGLQPHEKGKKYIYWLNKSLTVQHTAIHNTALCHYTFSHAYSV